MQSVTDRLRTIVNDTECIRGALTAVLSVDGKEWICRSCASFLLKRKIPPTSKLNGFDFGDIEPILENLTFAEEKLVGGRIVFQCIMERPSGGQYATKGGIVNVPTDFPITVATIPRQLSAKEVIAVSIKRRKTDPHAHMTKFVRVQVVKKAAKILVPKKLYQQNAIVLNGEWDGADLGESLQFLFGIESEEGCESVEEMSTDENDANSEFEGLGEDDPAVEFDTVACDFNTEPEVVYPVAPGEGQKPLSVFKDPQCGPLAFASVWGGEGRVEERQIPVTLGEALKAETRNKHRRFRRNGPYLCFNAVLSGIGQVSRDTMFALRKRRGDKSTITADDILNKDALQTLQITNRGFSFIKNVRFSPGYYAEKQKELLAWVRQLGQPTWFFTVSMPEHEWVDLLKILFRTAFPGEKVPDDDELLALSKAVKDELIKGDPASAVRHFDFKINQLLKKIIRQQYGPLGHVIDYFGVIEAQFRGSLHLHCLVWVHNPPQVDKHSDKEVCEFIDAAVSCRATLPEIDGVENLVTDYDRELPNMRQLHSHRATCKKGNKPTCRFGMPDFVMSETMVLRPLDLEGEAAKQALDIMKGIRTVLNAKEMRRKEQARLKWTIGQFLEKVSEHVGEEVTEELYLQAIRFSLKRTRIALRRDPEDVWINPYNPLILFLMKANMDLQFVLNPYDVARYITSYMTKVNKGMSELMRRIKKEHAKPDHATELDSLKSLGDAFVRSRELSVQEACVILLHQQSVYTTRSVEFVNTGDVEFRTEVLKSKEELSKLEPGSTDITYSNHRKRYIARPDELEDVCLADWFSMYVAVQYNTPGKCDDDASDEVPVNPRVYKLKTGGRVRLIADEAHYKVIRYCRFSVNKETESYYRELVILFCPFRVDDDSALLLGKQTFADAYRSVKNIVEKNRRKYERCRAEMEEALEEVQLDNLADNANETLETAARRFAPNITHYDDEDVAAGEEVLAGEVDDELTNLPVVPAAIPENEYFALIMRLNEDQQLFFYEMLSYERHRLSGFPTKPRFAFLSGGAGTGKSFVLKALHYALSKMAREDDKHLEYDIQKPTVAIGAFCGLAARNVGGSTLHSLLGMAFGVRPSTVDNITHSTLQNYRCSLLQLSTILADECSYIGNNFFFCMNERLKKIKCPSKNIPFGGVNVIVFGDLYQLQGVKEGWIFAPIKDHSLPNAEFATSVWEQYEMYELTTIVRQEEQSWAELLNRVRVNQPTDADLTRINRLVGKVVPELTHRACRKRHNAEVHNERMLAMCDSVQIATADDYVKYGDELPRHIVEGMKLNLYHVWCPRKKTATVLHGFVSR